GCGVDAGNVRRALDVAHSTAQHRLRSAEQKAVVYAANSKPIAAAAEGERAAASRATDDPAALIDRKRNAATIGIRVLEADAKQGDQRDQSASEQDRNSHVLTLSCFSRCGMDPGDSRLFHMTPPRGDFPHFGPRP